MNTMQTIANAKGSSLGATKLYPDEKESLNQGDWQKFCYTFKIAQFLALFSFLYGINNSSRRTNFSLNCAQVHGVADPRLDLPGCGPRLPEARLSLRDHTGRQLQSESQI